MAATLLLVVLLLGTALGQFSCLGTGQPQNVALTATVVQGLVESVQFISTMRLVLQTDDPNNNIYLSNDGGKSWFEPTLNDEAGALSSVVSCFPNSPTCYILRGNGNLWRSDDSGATFTLVMLQCQLFGCEKSICTMNGFPLSLSRGNNRYLWATLWRFTPSL
jgi:hypothetical protein